MKIIQTAVRRHAARRCTRRYINGNSENERESELLRHLMEIAGRVEKGVEWARNSYVGQLVSPPIEYQHMWGMVDGVTEEILQEVHKMDRGGDRSWKKETDEATLQKLREISQATTKCTCKELTISSADEERPEPETAFTALIKLLSYKRYRTTQEQATDELYARQPNFSEQTFLHEVEMRLLPSFLQAYWERDLNRLSSICTPSCFQVEVFPLLKEYENMKSRCRLLLASDSQIFNRLMMLDDSEFAASYESKAMPVLFVAVSAQIINCWVFSDVATANRRMQPTDYKNIAHGDPYVPEDYVYVLGLVPERHGRWVLASFRHCRAQAIQ
eukprot:TRINITY_DN355_c0_g1_i1.p1 TRINITY_DN355_c0_g1~~TRINITY_DN355_c0_g1_i1.p1  ORF type:complete len:330 (+),score=53.34 TRINITY_DN355_c0_g1_i1:254-1243(+)